MNKKVYIYGLGFMALLTACEKQTYDTVIPDQYKSVLSLKEFGEQSIDLYTTGEDGEYVFTVFKGGKAPEIATKVEVKVMDEVALQVYGENISREYKLLPADTYEVQQEEFEFASNVRYQKGQVVLKTTEIKKILDANQGRYVLPLELTKVNDIDSINAGKKILLIKPNVVTPSIEYSAPSASINIARTETTGSYEFYLTLPFDSPWDFEATVGVDEDATLDGYTKIATDDAIFSNAGKVTFSKGSRRSSVVTVTINNGTQVGPKNVLPIKVKSTSKQGIEVPQTPFNLMVQFNKVALTANMLSTNAQEPTEGAIANAVDGNDATFFHTSWSQGVNGTHYFQVQLTEAVTNMVFSYKTRHDGNGNTDISWYKLSVSADGNDWTELHTQNGDTPHGHSLVYISPVKTHTAPFTHIRIEAKGQPTRAFFTMAEFELWAK